MRLKDKLRAPVGGWYFDDPVMNKRISGGSLRELVSRVNSFRYANGIEDLSEEEIEDAICMRQPKERCWYTKKLGDSLTRVIHGVAGAVDRVLGTQLEKKARGCRKCGQRRVRLNQ